MPAPVSIIIPTLNAEAEIGPTLACLAEALTSGLIAEVILSEGGGSEAMARIAEDVGAVLVAGPPGRGAQLARGAAKARAPWLLFLHADTHLSAGWAEAAAAHIRQTPQKAGYFRLAFRAEGAAPRLVAAWANFRSRRFGLPYGDQGLLMSAALYEEVGGHPAVPLMEDVALARALAGRLAALAATAHTSAARYEREGWLRRGGRNLVLLARYLLGAAPEALAKSYAQKKP